MKKSTERSNVSLTKLLLQDVKKWPRCTDVTLAFDSFPDVSAMSRVFKLAFDAYLKVYGQIINRADFRDKEKFKALADQLKSVNLVAGAKRQNCKEALTHVLAWAKASAAMKKE